MNHASSKQTKQFTKIKKWKKKQVKINLTADNKVALRTILALSICNKIQLSVPKADNYSYIFIYNIKY